MNDFINARSLLTKFFLVILTILLTTLILQPNITNAKNVKKNKRTVSYTYNASVVGLNDTGQIVLKNITAANKSAKKSLRKKNGKFTRKNKARGILLADNADTFDSTMECEPSDDSIPEDFPDETGDETSLLTNNEECISYEEDDPGAFVNFFDYLTLPDDENQVTNLKITFTIKAPKNLYYKEVLKKQANEIIIRSYDGTPSSDGGF